MSRRLPAPDCDGVTWNVLWGEYKSIISLLDLTDKQEQSCPIISDIPNSSFRVHCNNSGFTFYNYQCDGRSNDSVGLYLILYLSELMTIIFQLAAMVLLSVKITGPAHFLSRRPARLTGWEVSHVSWLMLCSDNSFIFGSSGGYWVTYLAQSW